MNMQAINRDEKRVQPIQAAFSNVPRICVVVDKLVIVSRK